MRIIGPIVIGKRNLFAAAPEPREGAPEPLPSRRHGLVACSRSSGRSSKSNQSREHGEIVNGSPKSQSQKSEVRSQIAEVKLQLPEAGLIGWFNFFNLTSDFCLAVDFSHNCV